MPKYVNADLRQNLPDDLPYKSSVKRVLIQAPAEDVVPRSEVARIFEDIEKYYCINKFGEVVVYRDAIDELKKKYTEDNTHEN